MSQNNLYSVTALIIKDGLILAVSRKNNHKDFGLIGGKIDPGETPEEAIKREVKEETGISIQEMEVCFEDLDRVENYMPRPCRCYRIISWTGEPLSTEEGVVKWVKQEDLIDNCTFKNYNRKLFSEIKI